MKCSDRGIRRNPLEFAVDLLQSELLDFNHNVHFVLGGNGIASRSNIHSEQQCIETVS